MNRRRSLTVAAVAMTAAVMSGCSSGSGDLTKAGQSAIAPFVQKVRVAAASGVESRLKNAVDRLTREVQRQQQAGAISAGRASDIDDAAVRLESDFRPPTSPTPSVSTTSPTVTPTSPAHSPSPPPTVTITPTPTKTVTPSSSSSGSGTPFFTSKP